MGEFVQILKSVLMGIVQGITEWLPIATGHMLLLDEFIKITVSTISERNNEFLTFLRFLSN